MSLLDSHAPLKSTVMTIRPMVPWMNNDIKDAKSERRKLERKMCKSDSDIDKRAFKSKRNSVAYMSFAAQKEHYSGIIEESDGNQKVLFKVTNSLLGKNQETPLPPHETVACLVNEFNDFFIRKIDTLRDKLDNTQSSGTDFFTEDHGINFTPLSAFRPVSEDEVRKIIMKTPSKSCMLDPLPTQVLKLCIDLLIPVLTIMINLSLEKGYFPAEWKEAIIIPLIKKLGLETIFKSYRPVSNLLYVSKLCERVVAKQYCGHLTANKLYSKFQSAYREGHSTETALLYVQNDILMSMDKGEVTLLLLLDLSAAFDTLDHSILLKRLESRFGINGMALKWIKSYLTGRQQSVVINGVRSEKQALKYGVPQGSVLGPLLFTAYTAPLEDIADKHNLKIHMYADDTQPYISFKPTVPMAEENAVTILEDCVNDIRHWMYTNKLVLNDEKTVFLLIGRKSCTDKVSLTSIKVGETAISPSDPVLNLGSLWDNEMSMDKHISKICSSTFHHLRNIASIRKYLTKKQTEIIIHAYITSKLDYCNSLLKGVPEYQLNRLQLVQNAAARIVCRLKKYDHITDSRKTLHWLPIKQRIDFKILLIAYKSINGNGPEYLSDLILPYVTCYNLRSSDDDIMQVPRTNLVSCGDRAFSKVAPYMWNLLPPDVKNATSVECFKKKLKTHLFKLAYDV